MITEGKKTAKATGIRFIKAGEKETLAMEVAFTFVDPSDNLPHTFPWQGWLTEKAMDNTMRTLVEVLEYNGDDKIVSVPPGDRREGMIANQDCINRKKDVELVIEPEQYEDKNGVMRTRMRIKWVNNVGGGQFAGVSAEEIPSRLGQLGFKASFLAAKQNVGRPREAKPPVQAEQQQGGLGFSESDIPF